jgi:hypothetical protein
VGAASIIRSPPPLRSPSEFDVVSSSETKRASASLNFIQSPMADRVCRSYCIKMESIIRRAALICAALSLGVFSSALQAQQTTPEQPQTSQQQIPASVPPAPPPDRDTTPPPFPPMSRTAPRHRWVDMGGHRSARSHHVRSAVRHPSAARHVGRHERQSANGLTKAELRRCKSLSHHQLRRNSKCQAALRSERAARTHPAKTMTKAELRRCHRMSYRQLLQHQDCAALLQSELNSAHHATHHEKRRTTTRRHRTEASSQSRKAARHHGTRHRD